MRKIPLLKMCIHCLVTFLMQTLVYNCYKIIMKFSFFSIYNIVLGFCLFVCLFVCLNNDLVYVFYIASLRLLIFIAW